MLAEQPSIRLLMLRGRFPLAQATLEAHCSHYDHMGWSKLALYCRVLFAQCALKMHSQLQRKQQRDAARAKARAQSLPHGGGGDGGGGVGGAEWGALPQPQHQVDGGLVLDLGVLRKPAVVLQLLPGEQHPLVDRGNAHLVVHHSLHVRNARTLGHADKFDSSPGQCRHKQPNLVVVGLSWCVLMRGITRAFRCRRCPFTTICYFCAAFDRYLCQGMATP